MAWTGSEWYQLIKRPAYYLEQYREHRLENTSAVLECRNTGNLGGSYFCHITIENREHTAGTTA
jgi:hypothetical protein